MTSDTKKLIGIAAIGVIVYELWKRANVQPPSYAGFQVNTQSNIPVWAQQLSESIVQSSTSDPINDLMAVPQGPGGTPQYYGVPIPGFFGNPTCLLPPPGMNPSVQVFS